HGTTRAICQRPGVPPALRSDSHRTSEAASGLLRCSGLRSTAAPAKSVEERCHGGCLAALLRGASAAAVMSSSRKLGEGTGHDGPKHREVRDEDSMHLAVRDHDQAQLERHEPINAILGNVAPRTKRPATYEDLKRVPDTMVGEILDGELIATPRPSSPHARAASIVLADLMGPFDRDKGGPGGPGGWWLLVEPELHLHGDVVVPDVAGWRSGP